jgi:hypothetical protein
VKRGSGDTFYPRRGEEGGGGPVWGRTPHRGERGGGGASTTRSWAVMAGRWQDAGAAQAMPGRHGTGEGVRRR